MLSGNRDQLEPGAGMLTVSITKVWVTRKNQEGDFFIQWWYTAKHVRSHPGRHLGDQKG